MEDVTLSRRPLRFSFAVVRLNQERVYIDWPNDLFYRALIYGCTERCYVGVAVFSVGRRAWLSTLTELSADGSVTLLFSLDCCVTELARSRPNFSS